MRTASRRNSSLYLIAILCLLHCEYCSKETGTKQGQDQTFLTCESDSGARILTERFLDNLAKGSDYKTIELESNETIKQAVIAGLGIAILSRHTLTAELKTNQRVQVNLAGLPITRHWFLLHRRGCELPAVAQSFADFMVGLDGTFLPN